MKIRSIKSILLIMMLTGAGIVQAQEAEKHKPTFREVLQDLFLLHYQGEEIIIHLASEHLKPSTSLFSKVEVIDNRFDTTTIGFVNVGNGKYQYPTFINAPSQNLKDEISLAVDSIISNASKQEGTLLINVRKFFLAETGSASIQAGKFTYKAGYYLKQDTFYRQLFAVDTTIRVKKKSRDVTLRLLDTMKGTFSTFIQQAANFEPAQCDPAQLTFYDIQHIDEIEKRGFPAYQVDILQRGIYTSFEDFKSNHPSEEKFILEYRKGFTRPFVYEVTDDGKKGKEIMRKNYYIISDGEKMFISAIYGLYPLLKRNNDFYFTIGRTDNAQSSQTVTATNMYEVLGNLVLDIIHWRSFEFKIDYTTGKFLPVRKIETK
jgi:hypothetical protein